MAYKYGNRIKMTVSGTPGTGVITLGSAVAGFQAFSTLLTTGDTCPYVIEDSTNWEVGIATYNSTGPTLTRSVTASSAGGTTAISATSSAIVFSTPLAADLLLLAQLVIASGKILTANNSLTLAGTDGKTLTINGNAVLSNAITFAGTDATTMTFPNASDTVVGLAATQTLTNKTLTAPTVTDYTESSPASVNTGTAQTISTSNGTVIRYTMTGNCTFTMPTAAAGKSFVLIVSTGSGSFTGTFTGVKWPSGTAPTITTTASKWDILSFFSDGTNWYGTAAQAFA